MEKTTPCLGVLDALAARVAQHVPLVFGIVDLLGDEIPVPGRIATTLQDEPQTLFRLLQGLLSIFNSVQFVKQTTTCWIRPAVVFRISIAQQLARYTRFDEASQMPREFFPCIE